MTHFLQSSAWQAFQEALGRKTFVRSGKGWSYMAILETGTGNRRLYCPYGPECSDLASFRAAIASLRDLADEQRADFIRVEPMNKVTVSQLRQEGFRKVGYQQLQPEHTRIIELAGKTSEEILAGMTQNARNRYRTYSKREIIIHESVDPADIELFLKLIKKVASRTGLVPHSDKYFKAQAQTLMPLGAAKIFYASVGGTPVAVSVVFDGEKTRSYAHAAADDDFRKLVPGTVLLAYMIMDAHQRGMERFDLYGIAPSDQPDHPWAGFSKFKQQFGGMPVAYLGAWDLPVRPLRYHGYRAYQSARKRLKKRNRS